MTERRTELPISSRSKPGLLMKRRMAMGRRPMITTITELMPMKIVKITRLSNGLQEISSKGRTTRIMMMTAMVAMMTDKKRLPGPPPQTTGANSSKMISSGLHNLQIKCV